MSASVERTSTRPRASYVSVEASSSPGSIVLRRPPTSYSYAVEATVEVASVTRLPVTS
jgi:hypothetical protein